MINISSNRLKNDKYYTSKELAKYCIDKTYELIGKENISEVIDPSAGNGSFNSQIDNCIAYDIEPEAESIIKQNYLDLDITYKKSRLIITNPPYGAKLNLAIAFYKKSIEISDYISFILPISQLNNNINMYEFDLIHSEDLGKQIYTDREVHCCLNIYRKNQNGYNPKPNYKLKDVEIIEVRKGNKIVNDYDIRIKAWGGSPKVKLATLGQEIKDNGKYAKEFYIKIHNKKYRDEILKIFRETNWVNIYPMTSTPNLTHTMVYKYLKEKISQLT